MKLPSAPGAAARPAVPAAPPPATTGPKPAPLGLGSQGFKIDMGYPSYGTGWTFHGRDGSLRLSRAGQMTWRPTGAATDVPVLDQREIQAFRNAMRLNVGPEVLAVIDKALAPATAPTAIPGARAPGAAAPASLFPVSGIPSAASVFAPAPRASAAGAPPAARPPAALPAAVDFRGQDLRINRSYPRYDQGWSFNGIGGELFVHRQGQVTWQPQGAPAATPITSGSQLQQLRDTLRLNVGPEVIAALDTSIAALPR